MISELKNFINKGTTLLIYSNGDIVFGENDERPMAKENSSSIELNIHPITAIQQNTVNEILESVTPPNRLAVDGSQAIDPDSKEPLFDYDDKAFLKAKAHSLLEARCLVIYHGCDSLRQDIDAKNGKPIDIADSLPDSLIKTISDHIQNTVPIAFNSRFFLNDSSPATPS